MLNDVQRHAADNHREQHAVVSMGARKWPNGHLLGEAVKGLADAAAAPVDVPEKLGLSEPAVGEAVGVSSNGCAGAHGSNSACAAGPVV